jgi:phosphoribosyl 1,2-cyclic phosphodiesterase
MKVCALASGSSGNCFYVENEFHGMNQGFLVDGGISCKRICERLAQIGRSEDNVKAILVTHEHSDHIKGIDVFTRKFNVPVFATKATFYSRFIIGNDKLRHEIKNDETFKLIGLNISAFSKSHLCADPVSFSIKDKNNKTLTIATDVGYACQNINDAVADSDFLCFESNYDERMLDEGFYPWPTKKWIKSDKGHLSNTQSAACVIENARKKLKHVMLSHISQNNNTPEKASETHSYFFKQRAGFNPTLSISSREICTPLFKV